MVIAIDGPAGAGKSTVARAVASALGLDYLDTGAMYRAVTAAALRGEVPLDDHRALADLAARLALDVEVDRIAIDGVDVTEEIRGPEVTAAVSRVAAVPEVRAVLVDRQRRWIHGHGGGVLEGRDIGTVVVPDATVKVFVTATPRVRAERRVAQSGGVVEEVAAAIAERDRRDSERADSPLRPADDAITIDTSDLTVAEVVEQITGLARSTAPDERASGRSTEVAIDVADWLPRTQGRFSRAAYRVCRFVLTWAVRLYTRTSIDGRQHVPARGAFILCPVHRSNVDTPIAACVTTRRMRFMGKDSLWKWRWFGWIAYTLGAIPVRRGTADREAFRRSLAVLENGEPLVLFPEGERKTGPTVFPLFDGAVYMAAKAGVPIIPVGIGGSESVMPKGSKMIYPRKTHVIVGEPIFVPVNDGSRVSRRMVAEYSDLLHGRLQELFDEAQRRAGVRRADATRTR